MDRLVAICHILIATTPLSVGKVLVKTPKVGKTILARLEREDGSHDQLWAEVLGLRNFRIGEGFGKYRRAESEW
jgi:hypothetical protein